MDKNTFFLQHVGSENKPDLIVMNEFIINIASEILFAKNNLIFINM